MWFCSIVGFVVPRHKRSMDRLDSELSYNIVHRIGKTNERSSAFKISSLGQSNRKLCVASLWQHSSQDSTVKVKSVAKTKQNTKNDRERNAIWSDIEIATDYFVLLLLQTAEWIQQTTVSPNTEVTETQGKSLKPQLSTSRPRVLTIHCCNHRLKPLASRIGSREREKEREKAQTCTVGLSFVCLPTWLSRGSWAAPWWRSLRRWAPFGWRWCGPFPASYKQYCILHIREGRLLILWWDWSAAPAVKSRDQQITCATHSTSD